MTEKTFDEKLHNDFRKLSLIIYGFLLDEHSKDRYTEVAKRSIIRAADCIKKVYKFSFADQIVLRMMHPLQRIFAVAQYPVSIKNRITAESHKRQGNNFMEANMFKFADVEYTKAIDLNPGNAIYYCNRAASRIGLRSFGEAIEDCGKALQLDKNYVKAYCWLGLGYLLMDNPALAVRYYRKALKIEPNNPVFIANMRLIRNRLEHETLRVFQPLFEYKQNAVPMLTDVVFSKTCQKDSGGDHVDINEADRNKISKFNNFEIDDKIKAALFIVKK